MSESGYFNWFVVEMDESNFVPDGWLDDDPTLEVEALDYRGQRDMSDNPPSLCVYTPPGKKPFFDKKHCN